MTAKLIDGKAVGAAVLAESAAKAQHLLERTGVIPGLAVVLVGDDPASSIYVRNKQRACGTAGVRSTLVNLPAEARTQDVIAEVDRLNDDPAIHGIIVQLPLPAGIDTRRVIERISVDKDADGFHLYNVGSLVTGQTVFPPCTPDGVMRLLDHEGISLAGKNVVIVGASNVVGKPMALMALQREATVTVCHAKTRDLSEFTVLADILIVAAGQANLITGPMVREGAVVIDVGINRLDNGSITGDVVFDDVARKASMLTPVPGGVGPMTVAVLIANTVAAAERMAAAAPAEFVG
ncbi:MAG: bifunctional methylenetetrahydrofolate dehydrogenase/methenyltetrahydrofolate cyclohydrolase FolD [Actinomycetales bacterium]